MNAGGEKEKEKNRDIGNWTTGEKQDFLKFFSIYGRNWKMLASHIPSKTQVTLTRSYQFSLIHCKADEGCSFFIFIAIIKSYCIDPDQELLPQLQNQAAAV